jgi:protein-disulfide isomerase
MSPLLVRVLLPLMAAGLPAAGACAKKSGEVSGEVSREVSARVPASAGAAPMAADKGQDSTPAPGVDLTKLDEFERKVFFRVVNKESSACGKAHSLLHSVKTDKGCRKSLYAARYVARLVDGGYTDSEIGESIQKRFRVERATVELGDSPIKGPPNAPVTVVEFVDYECPHCKRVQPVLRQVLEEYKDEVKVVFKHYPLGAHTNARAAAEAAMAAHKQGKFWAFNDKIWAISESLTLAGLEQIAKDVGLDVAKWRADFESAATKARVQHDRDQGQRLALEATPTVYINGRLFTDNRDIDSFKDWINEELNR